MPDRKEPATSPKTEETLTSATGKEAPPQVQIDESGAVCAYANFCRVTGTPEELILAI